MKILIICSKKFYSKIEEVKKNLEKKNIEVFLPNCYDDPTAEQKAFCSITGEIFKIASDKRNSIDDIAKNVNIYLTNNKYPMWAMKYYIENKMGDHTYCDEMVQLTDLLCEFIKPESKIDRDRSKIVDDIRILHMTTVTHRNIITLGKMHLFHAIQDSFCQCRIIHLKWPFPAIVYFKL